MSTSKDFPLHHRCLARLTEDSLFRLLLSASWFSTIKRNWCLTFRAIRDLTNFACPVAAHANQNEFGPYKRPFATNNPFCCFHQNVGWLEKTEIRALRLNLFCNLDEYHKLLNYEQLEGLKGCVWEQQLESSTSFNIPSSLPPSLPPLRIPA